MEADIVIIGGGCVGLSVAYQLTRKYPSKSVIVLEKEREVASHQTGRNSGVLHSGIYYKPGSSKAVYCRKGKHDLEQFCRENYILHERTGKLIVASGSREEEKLHEIFRRGKENEVDCRLVTRSEMLSIEPHVAGTSAVHVPETGIVNFKEVCDCLCEKITEFGKGQVVRRHEVVGIDNHGVHVENKKKTLIRCGMVVNCAGLYADKIARLAGMKPKVRIIPFRGEYYTLKPEAVPLVRGLIYPVPDPRFPFLGVHFTKVSGGVECGPNAVLAFGKECYNRTDINFREAWETLTYPGFWRLCAKYWRTGLEEMGRSFSKSSYVRSLKKLVPAIREEHLLDNRPAGIRAQAVNPDGTLVDDFLIERQDNIIHVSNTPSPAATACLAIGEQIAKEI